MTDESKPKPAGKNRSCWCCGADMGWIANVHYDRLDTCGAAECAREERAAYQEQREEAHREVDDRFDGGW